MARIVVTPLSAVPSAALLHQPSHVITLLSPTTAGLTVPDIDPDNHLRLSFNDIAVVQDGLIIPTADHAAQLMAFIANWPGEKPLLIHCWAGISRSTAAAYAALCARHPDESEVTLAQALRHASPTATPNRLIVAFADDILGRGGRMVDAVDSIGRGRDATEGQVFVLETR